jgi:hypothetical protein
MYISKQPFHKFKQPFRKSKQTFHKSKQTFRKFKQPFRNYENEKQFQAQSISIITGPRHRKNRHIPQLTQKFNSNRNLRNSNQNLRNNNRNLSSDC